MNSKSEIKKITKKLNVHVSSQGINILNNLITQLCHILSTKSLDGDVLESMDIKRYLQKLSPNSLIKEMIRKGDVAILQYNSVEPGKENIEQTSSQRAKLHLSIDKMEKLIESHIKTDVEISASIYITAIIEYCITQILCKV